MHKFIGKIGISNSRQAPHEVWVEPWANDYTLLAGEKLEVIAFGNSAMTWFTVVEWDGATQVYCDDTDDFKVMQEDRELVCGHQRQD